MRPQYIAVLMVLLCALSTALPTAVAAPEDEEIPMLRILFPDREYAVGEQLDVTLELTVNGRLTNADFQTMVLAVIWNFTFGQGGPTNVQYFTEYGGNISRVSTGIYEVSFTIEPEHVTAMVPMGEGLPFMSKIVFMMAMCNYGGVDPVAMRTMAMATIDGGPSIQVGVSDLYPSPGEIVTITVTTSNGTKVDAADVKVNLTSYDGETQMNLGTLGDTRESTGVYKASYTVPVDLDTATLYTVQAGASFPDYNDTVYLQPFFGTGFMVSFYDIWLQNVSATDDESEVAVWVADPEGVALEGVDISTTITVYDGSGYTDTDISNTTDENGRAGFVISHPSAERVDVKGMVDDGVRTQRFYMEAIIDRSQVQPPVPDELGDFIVEPWETPEGDIFDSIKYPGDPIHTTYRAFNMSGPVANKRINWFLVDRDGFFDTNFTIIDSGFEVTDGSGDFDITYELPSKDVNAWLMFQAVMWNTEDEDIQSMESTQALIDSGFFPIDEDIKLSVDRVYKGDPVELRATVPLPESYFIGSFLAVVDKDTEMTTWGQPMSLGPEADDFPVVPLQKMGPNTFGMDKQLPDFFPEDQSVAFLVLSVDLEKFRIMANYVMLDYGGSTSKDVDAYPIPTEPVHAGNQGYIEVAVDNTGMGTDTYSVSQDSGPDWLTWEQDPLTIEPAETMNFAAYVDVPTDADEGRYWFNLTVVSVDDPSATVTVETYLDVMVNGVDLSVEPAEADAYRGDSVNFVLTINNSGQGEDTYDIVLSGPAAEWASLSQARVMVPEGGEAEVVIQVNVTEGADEDAYWLNATATSSDGVTTADIKVMVNVFVDDVEVEADTDQVDAFPGATVEVWFNVTNTGQGTDTFTFTLEGDPAAWAELSSESVEVEEGATVRVMVEVTVPDDTPEEWYDLTLVATSASGKAEDSAMSAVYVQVNGVDLTCPEPMIKARRGDQVVFTLSVENTGENRDVYTLSHTGSAWAELILFGANPVGFDEDASGDVGVTVGLSDTIAEGTYHLTVTATSQDGVTKASVDLTVQVTVNGVSIALSEGVMTTKPGKTITVTLTVENTGEGEDTYTVQLGNAAANWTTAEPVEVTVAEGATKDVTLTVVVPKDQKAGDAFVSITVVSSDPAFEASTQLQVIIEEEEDGGGIAIWIWLVIIAVALVVVVMVFFLVTSKKPL